MCPYLHSGEIWQWRFVSTTARQVEQILTHRQLRERSAEGREHLLLGAERDQCWVAEVELQSSLKVALGSALRPEENEALALDTLSDRLQLLQVLVAAVLARVQKVRKEGDDANLASCSASLVEDALINELVDGWRRAVGRSKL